MRSIGVVASWTILETDGIEEEKTTVTVDTHICTSAAETILGRTRSTSPIKHSCTSLGTTTDALTVVKIVGTNTGSANRGRSASGTVGWTGHACSCLRKHLGRTLGQTLTIQQKSAIASSASAR